MDYLSKAIRKLKPESEFSFIEQDYSTINWIVLDGEAPTKAQIDAAIKTIKEEEAKAEIDAQAKKQAAEAKLAALGLTVEDLKVLGLA